ncbi:MAG: homogentisate 1,2-dioxygenase [Actinomycetota bacterium]
MPNYRRVGSIPRKRHIVHRGADGSRLMEELFGQDGFSSASALLYHRHSPSAVVAIESIDTQQPEFRLDEPLTPRHLRTGSLEKIVDVALDRHALLGNSDVAMSWAEISQASSLYRNASCDELVYVHSGSGRIETIFGTLEVSVGDYVVIPKGTTLRWCPEQSMGLLFIESRGHVRTPQRYLSKNGQFLEGSPYSERDLRAPEATLIAEGENVPLVVRHQSGISRHIYRHHPFDVEGWDGALYPWALNINDFEPIVGRIHQPPPVHQTFEGDGFVICSFVPRLLDFDPNAVKVPYHHSNSDSDEVLFYSAGNFASRVGSGIGVGSISFHPTGFVHGPQPGSFESSVDKNSTDELAVMLDTFKPLGVARSGRDISDPNYAWSWAKGE